MKGDAREFRELLKRFEDLKILVIGDIMLDRYIWGDVSRISPEAPVPVVAVSKTEDRLGGAGNVVRNLVELGVQVNVCGLIGDDKEGDLAKELFRRDGVGVDGVIVDSDRPTTTKTRVVAQAQQVVRIDGEKSGTGVPAIQERFVSFIDDIISEYDAVIISDYGKGVISRPVMQKFDEIRTERPEGSSRPIIALDPHPVNYGIYKGVDIIKPNKVESETAAGMLIPDREAAFKACNILKEKWNCDSLMITLGGKGMVISSSADEIALDAVAREVFDVSGAGDTVISTYVPGIAAGASLWHAGTLANIAAGIVVSEVGTAPIKKEQLEEEISKMEIV